MDFKINWTKVQGRIKKVSLLHNQLALTNKFHGQLI